MADPVVVPMLTVEPWAEIAVLGMEVLLKS
jgi:hypothetical protein